MFAGAGALFEEQWKIPYFVGALVTAVLTLFVTLWGVQGVPAVNTVIVPLLITSSVLAFVHTVRNQFLPAASLEVVALPGIFPIVRTGLTYASFNLVLSIGVLAPMGGATQDRKSLSFGSLLGGGLLTILLCMGNYSLLHYIPEVFDRQIPQLLIVQEMGKAFVTFYSLVVWMEIFSTSVGNLFSIHTMIQEKFKTKSALPAIAATAAGLIICAMGFSNIISRFYPILGIIGFVLSVLILILKE